jgi:hypothetical protein
MNMGNLAGAVVLAILPVCWGATIPTGTTITVRMIDSVDSKTDTAGKTFRAAVDEAVIVDGKTLIPKGADATAKLAESRNSGRLTGKPELILSLATITLAGKTYDISASEAVIAGKSRTKRTGTLVGAGAALGAIIGGIAGGGKGAAIGAATGAGAGGAYQVLTKGEAVKIPAETRLSFTLGQPLTI